MPASDVQTPGAAQAGEPGGALPVVREFASTRALSRDALIAAPIRWPRPARLREPLQAQAKRVAAGLSTLELHSVGDLLEHLPSASRQARTVAALRAGEQATVSVQVRRIGARAVRRRGMRPLVEANVFDATGTMRATFFNQPWLVERYPQGTRVILHGKADGRGGFNVSHHAPGTQDATATAAGEGDAVAHYPAADGVTSTQILTLVAERRDALADVVEPLSAATRVAERMPERAGALAAMHFPRQPQDLEAGRRRLAFEELLITQLAFLRRRAGRRLRTGAPRLAEADTLGERWLSGGLPFALTGDQRRAIDEIRADLAQDVPMQRLLMGEVGSGKTVVALYAMLQAVGHGRQAALMAPTETLAEQHFATIQRLLGGELLTMELLTGSTSASRRRETLERLRSGELALIVGTHALIEPDVRFDALAVAIIDEQHRFGVRQRAALGERVSGGDVRGEDEPVGTHAHVLHMTATPIPRTLALARYGDLDTSTLRELPLGRQPIETRLIAGEAERADAYERVRAEVRAGRQAYVICPLVEEQDDAPTGAGAGTDADAGTSAGRPLESALRAAGAELRRLSEGELKGYSLQLLHGGMRPREKHEAMAAFASGAAQVLIATTVVEVGIDVPNATVMLIENAERFGISQLHQLRGRIGRGEHGGVCLLVGSAGSARLRALVEHQDGFRLAGIDLALRREGELLGVRQSGVGQFRVARLPEDDDLLERARARAETIMASDPHLRSPEHALLADALAGAAGDGAAAPYR